MSVNNEDKQLTDGMKNMNLTCTTKEEVDVCACCGKEGSELNICNKCKMVKYCNAACKKKHRSKHKKKCERRVAELQDLELFKQPPPREDCPICFLPLPRLGMGSKYNACCGKEICSGCIYAPVYDNLGNIIGNGEDTCPFCRTLAQCSEEEIIKRLKKRKEVGDAEAIFSLGCCYSNGLFGMPRDYAKALELGHQAGELGCAAAYCNIGNAYYNGDGVERDEKKAKDYYELAAMGGSVYARHSLGNAEWRTGNWDRAIKHWLIAAGAGYNDSVKNIQQLYMDGHATKEDYTSALRAFQKCIDEIRSDQRDIAAADSDIYKYY